METPRDEEAVETLPDPQIALWKVQACMRLSSIALIRPMTLDQFHGHIEVKEVKQWLENKVGDQALEVVNDWLSANLYLFER